MIEGRRTAAGMAETVEGRQTTASNASEVGSSNCQRQGHAGVGDSFLPVSTDPEAPSDSGSGENNVEDTETEEITSDNGAESCLLDGNDLSALPKNRAWRPSEDRKLQELVAKHGASNWSKLAEQIPGRSGKSCRLRWYNQLSPEVKQVGFNLIPPIPLPASFQ